MRNTIRFLITATLVIAALGCSKKGSDNNGASGPGSPFNPFNPGGVPPITDPQTPVNPISGGATVDFVPTSQTRFDDYLGFSSNSPSEFKLNVKLALYDVKTGRLGNDYVYGGFVRISFKDNGTTYTDTFSSMVNSSGTVGSNKENNKYNIMTRDFPEMAGANAYHGFFEDVRGRSNMTLPVFGGAVILVINSTNDLGDGQGPSSANGEVWYKNYSGDYFVSPTSCWFVSAGPYDCRTWRSDGNVDTKRALYPDNRYTKLGTFTNLDITKAFSN